MIDKKLLDSLSSKEKKDLIEGLDLLIKQTYNAEKEFKALNTLFIQIIEFMPVAIYIFDKDKSLFLKNSEAEKLTNIIKLIDLNDKNIDNLKIEHKKKFYSIKIARHDKTIVVINDMTEERKKERLASMGQVAAHLTHEIRNPIGSVSLLADTLFKKVDFTTKPIVYEIKKSIWRVERIIKATLMFTKGIQLDKKKFELSALKEDIEEVLNLYSYTKDIDFNINIPEKDTIHADLGLLSIVFQNMIFNAIDAIEDTEEESGTINISYLKDKKYHKFVIEDSGIPIQDKNKLFEAFKTTKLKGNGLGLALSKQIIEAHGGDIIVSMKPKKFTISIKV